ncbi:hypothetical protein Pint_31300 [Pistacia integerrima]|uniref:Uncharacterized protein n=1 Tax=Pistacia integerrima TaxID=434235 RepID=A0ACC0XRJ9_9ROSI|nr:hypothetical protein Pint_31300 [Pistacia integerrima]
MLVCTDWLCPCFWLCRVRFHYGHPDVFDRVFHLTRGGVSKASKVINLSEDKFAGSVTHHEYIQVGKGRDVGLNQISMFEAKIANGSGEQTLSRDIYRLGHQFDFFRMLTCYFTTIGFYLSRLNLVLSGLEEGLSTQPAIQDNMPQVALASQSFVQFGFLMVLPMSTGRGFVVFHTKFADNYRLYSRSYFVKGIEMMIMLIVYQIFGQSCRGTVAYILITISMWFMVGTWLFVPFLFNPSGFEWQKIVDDWTDWNKWIRNQGGIGVPPEKSWESWWEEEQEHLRHSGVVGIIAEILLSLRVFIYQYGLVYHLNITKYVNLEIAQALKPLVQRAGFWELVRTFAYCYEIVMGLLLFTVVHFWRGFLSSRYSRLLCSLAKRLQRSADFLYSRRPKEISHFLKQ